MLCVLQAARVSLHRTNPEARTLTALLDSIPVRERTPGEGIKRGCVFASVVGPQRVIVCGSLTTWVQLIGD